MRNSGPARAGTWMSDTMSPADPAPAISIRPCHSHEDLKLCVDLQRRIWNFADEDVVPAAMFVVALHTGGHVYCAFRGQEPAGFALAYSAGGDGRRFWHSHMVGVLPEYQNHGIGRLLKLHQRDEALRAGIDVIEWTFDPLELRNAYFNISRLGAIVRHYIPDCYGTTTSPLHGSLPTDRLVAEWNVASDRVNGVLKRAAIRVSADAVEIPVPAREVRTQAIQTALRTKLTDLFSRGYAITGFRREPEHCTYILEPYEN